MSTDDRPASEPRQTLAMRLAERNRQRALRAERLARLRPGAPAEPALHRLPEGFAEAGAGLGREPAAPDDATTTDDATDDAEAIDSAEALEAFLRALTGDRPAVLPSAAEPAAVLSFQRPERSPERPAERPPERPPVRPEDPGDLARLAGAGPGLIWALQRAGFRRLADLAPLGPDELVARLGPIGRLVPAEAWLATARATPEA